MNAPPDRTYWVYIMTNRSGTLYIGLTKNLMRRIQEHRLGRVAGFTAQYKITRLIHAEPFSEVRDALGREKQLKGWTRAKKLALIAASNPDWRDLGDDWLGVSAEEY
jgi:putative endonuclease